MPRLPHSPRVLAWLQQFELPDRPVAEGLLRSLTYVSTSDMEVALVEALHELRATRSPDRPVALYATREAPRVPLGGHLTDLNRLLRGAQPAPSKARNRQPVEAPPYFSYEDRQAPVQRVDAQHSLGSEAMVGRFVRNLVRDAGARAFLDHPSLHALAAVKCRLLVCIDDIIASGSRTDGFVRWQYAHPTLKSWHSYGLVRTVALAHSGTVQGVRRVQDNPFVESVVTLASASAARNLWSHDFQAQVQSLCTNYARLTSRPKWPLGFDDTFSLTIYEHKCPNTAPAILWAEGPRWRAVFNERPRLGLAAWPKTEASPAQERQLLSRLGQDRLLRADWQALVRPSARSLVLFLAASASGFRHLTSIAAFMDTTHQAAAALRAQCHTLGWIDEDGRPTAQGCSELEHLRQLGTVRPGRAPRARPLQDAYYFPVSLRGSRGTI